MPIKGNVIVADDGRHTINQYEFNGLYYVEVFDGDIYEGVCFLKKTLIFRTQWQADLYCKCFGIDSLEEV